MTPHPGTTDRATWTQMLDRIARPVLDALANGQLKATMPVETAHPRPRDRVTHLEAFGRLLAGLAPWLEAPDLTGEEVAQRDDLRALAQRSLRAACDPQSPDALDFGGHRQALVDAAFLAQGLLRAPRALWADLDAETRERVIAAMQRTRAILPFPNNWLLFAGMVEAFLLHATGECDTMRVDYALRQHEQWYLGDGTYSDGPRFHWDYYNSYVIQPMLLDILRTVRGRVDGWDALEAPVLERAQRHAAVLERLIAPDGSFPVMGRSITYRVGAFHLLAQLAWEARLPAGIVPAQVRGALTAAIRRSLDVPGTFDDHGWLRIGLAGHQPGLAESYISTGSLYLTSLAFLPLGLSPGHVFWSGDPVPWTAQRIWAGENALADHALDDETLS